MEKNNDKINNATKRIASLYFDEDTKFANSVITEIKKQIIDIDKENWIIKLFIKEIKVYQDNKIEIIWRC